MTALVVVTAVIVGLTIWYPRTVPTDAPNEKYPPAATSVVPTVDPAPAVEPAPVVKPSPAPTSAPPPTTAVEVPTTEASETYTPTYVPPSVVSEAPTTTAPSTTDTPPPTVAPSTRSRPRTNVTRSDNPYHVPTYTGAPKP